ncbi:hypothetical protein ABFS83_09G022100 [Erythranthe nasuta]
MATPSDAPPSLADENPQNPGFFPQVTQPTNDNLQDTVKESSPTSVFVNSEPIREDQVQNAIKFLSHPKVRGSPVVYRRSFLERKGLTKEEIDEAFRRVPDPTPPVTTTPSVVTNQDGQIKSSGNAQQQPPAQALQQITPVGNVNSNSKMGRLARFQWYHGILAVGFLAVSGAGTAILFKNSIVPRFKSWIRRIVLEEDEEGVMKKNDAKPSIAEEAAAAAKSAAAAAADVARASQEMLITKSEEKRCFEELIKMLNVQVHEMKSMSNAIQKLEVGQSINGRSAAEEQYQRVSGTSSRQPYANGRADTDSRSVRSLSPPAPVEPSAAPHPKSYMDIMAMIQRGEKPSNIREINDAPPNPSQPLSNPRLAPRLKPWESQNSAPNNYPAQDSINASNYDFQDNQMNGDNAAASSWWQQKNARITEIETPNTTMVNERGPPAIQRSSSWVPPQPPPVVMPEAAAAIRQPKKSPYQMEQLTDDQLLARSSADANDELQRITKISESGGTVLESTNGGIYSNEISNEENGSYFET